MKIKGFRAYFAEKEIENQKRKIIEMEQAAKYHLDFVLLPKLNGKRGQLAFIIISDTKPVSGKVEQIFLFDRPLIDTPADANQPLLFVKEIPVIWYFVLLSASRRILPEPAAACFTNSNVEHRAGAVPAAENQIGAYTI